jgi:hypothetical protein
MVQLAWATCRRDALPSSAQPWQRRINRWFSPASTQGEFPARVAVPMMRPIDIATRRT